MGRAKGTGGPMSGGDEAAEPDFGATDKITGAALIGPMAHVRLAHPTANDGAKLLRRGYNFVDGSNGLGQLAAGLFFIAFQRDPRRAFIPIQRSLAGPTNDLLNEYIVHVGSGLFACPGGVEGNDTGARRCSPDRPHVRPAGRRTGPGREGVGGRALSASAHRACRYLDPAGGRLAGSAWHNGAPGTKVTELLG
ncbi:MAG: hypothetical protein WKF83_14040 [Nocardioidaceae bacterium]